MQKILLASGSIYRQELLTRLKIPFESYAPEIDETPLPNEPLTELVIRLAKEKASAAAKIFPDHICIGSDEVAGLAGRILGKPQNYENAYAQLQSMSGQQVYFYTGVCVYAPFLNHEETHLATCAVQFRALSSSMIENYLNKETPFASAASFKSETLGSALIERFEGTDPTAIIGLPLIALCEMLRKVGVAVI